MTKDTIRRPSAGLPRGFRDISGAEVAAEAHMLSQIRDVPQHDLIGIGACFDT